eukprot:CAMPEP_0114121570 /NCGR_PEP_ID=MMETSP0043_2-20121206/7245_1 /TAXON_ID=464988 /ORGANISM="Hemiselmis andersenii, Strain CCMP644" /LENGTH=97 /DNA_ID=CAMNT_0001214253 /DNA_START=295 /DNA_END=589 /DNA_ORIENTATION=+
MVPWRAKKYESPWQEPSLGEVVGYLGGLCKVGSKDNVCGHVLSVVLPLELIDEKLSHVRTVVDIPKLGSNFCHSFGNLAPVEAQAEHVAFAMTSTST